MTSFKLWFQCLFAAFLISLSSCNSQDAALRRVFQSPIPAGTFIQHYDWQSMGPDCAEVFVFKTQDDEFLNQLIVDWTLVPTAEPSSSYKSKSSIWWPSHEKRTEMERKFENVDKDKEVFKSVWVGKNGLMYIERSSW